jgi:outer membrane lipoprotein
MRHLRTVVPVLCILIPVICAGCFSPVSKSVREEVNREISFEQLRNAPVDYMGETVLLGGEIIQTRNTTEGTLLYVLQKELDYRGKPQKDDRTGGRFLVQHPAFLDPVVYSSGRLVTVAGRVMGKREKKIDELDYAYPVLHAREIRLWPDEPNRSEYTFRPYFYYHYPWYWGSATLAPWY